MTAILEKPTELSCLCDPRLRELHFREKQIIVTHGKLLAKNAPQNLAMRFIYVTFQKQFMSLKKSNDKCWPRAALHMLHISGNNVLGLILDCKTLTLRTYYLANIDQITLNHKP